METKMLLGNGNILRIEQVANGHRVTIKDEDGNNVDRVMVFRSETAAIEYAREQDRKYARYCERCGKRLTANDIEDYGSFCECCVEDAGGYDNL